MNDLWGGRVPIFFELLRDQRPNLPVLIKDLRKKQKQWDNEHG